MDITRYILNEKNQLITIEYINSIFDKLGIKYTIRNLSIFQKALVHESYTIRDYSSDKSLKNIQDRAQPISNPKKAIPLQSESYERLEFLGDSVVHMSLAEYLYIRYPNESEGFMTRLRAKIENGKTLAHLARQLGLHNYVLLAKYIEDIGGRMKNEHIFEDTLESFVGALFIDSESNYELCKSFVIALIEKFINIPQLLHTNTNYKDTLLQFFHKQKWGEPRYYTIETIERVDPKTNKTKRQFKMGVSNHQGQLLGWGIATCKKSGEQLAAKYILDKHNVDLSSNAPESEDEEYTPIHK